ncbi:outer membrane protein assembly factor BamC [Aquisalimonas sp.]|uniref:outer membrane protein assembly factor BamC n=1 Tax=Aquisalimonas sp. TaxID=1872621 RepID=UPI0025BEA442|nr:outer membrane protein assembly factor BamC [Aquisalimonas sp.]
MLRCPKCRPLAPLSLVAVVAILLAACGGRGEEELDRSERLSIPPDLSSERIGEIPEMRGDRGRSSLGGEERREQARAARDVAPEPVGLRMRQQGAERWLQVQAAPEQVWEGLERWLEDERVPVARSDKERGVIETGWLSRPMGPSGGALLPLERDPEAAPLAEQYLIRVEPTDEPERSEVFVAHRRVAAAGDNGWAPRPADRGLEAEMLRGFMLYLGADEAFAAQQVAQRERRVSQLETGDDGEPRLLVRDGYLQSWQRVGLALDRAAFTVEDRNRARGRFLVRYDPTAEDQDDGPGFFARMAFWREREPELEPGTYAIVLGSADQGTAVTVSTEDGERVPDVLAERLLTLIEDQLR